MDTVDDDALLEATIEWVDQHFAYDIESKGWESPRQLWEHLVVCDICSVFGDCPYIEDNPDKPMHGPKLPFELWDPMSQMVYKAYMPTLERVFAGPRMIAGTVQVSKQMLD